MSVETTVFKAIGTRPLILHNGHLANPRDKYSKMIKEVTGKKHKTEADLEEIARLNWFGGMYAAGSPPVPVVLGEGMEAAIRSAAKISKRGKDVQQGLACPESHYQIEYVGTKDLDEMWKSGEFASEAMVKVGQSKVERTRPMFNEWSIPFDVEYETEILSRDDVIHFVTLLGNRVGIFDWRPRYGKFFTEILRG